MLCTHTLHELYAGVFEEQTPSRQQQSLKVQYHKVQWRRRLILPMKSILPSLARRRCWKVNTGVLQEVPK